MVRVGAGNAMVLGVLGMMSLTVRRLGDGMGVHRTLGARPRVVLRRVVRYSGGPAVTGSAICVAELLRGPGSLLQDVRPTDPLAFGAGTTLLAGVALAACLVPALRATRHDQARLLRHD